MIPTDYKCLMSDVPISHLPTVTVKEPSLVINSTKGGQTLPEPKTKTLCMTLLAAICNPRGTDTHAQMSYEFPIFYIKTSTD